MKEWRRRRKGLSEQRRRGKHRKERERMIRGLCNGREIMGGEERDRKGRGWNKGGRKKNDKIRRIKYRK